MSSETQKKIYIVVPYFGKLPSYIDLWLYSCGNNLDFNWVLLTDDDFGGLQIPSNVIVQKSSLISIQKSLSKALGLEIALNSPYKLCDFRPVYWMLLDDLGLKYDFWGHCDLDMIFGQLSNFITAEMLNRYEKIFTLGHLTLYKNSPIAKWAFMLSSSAPNWRDVFTQSRHFGFDEHIGVNLTWHEWDLLQYENEGIVADIDPGYPDFYLTQHVLNQTKQLFSYNEGRVLQGFYRLGVWQTKEFAYIHFQKRKMIKHDLSLEASIFSIGPLGFQEIKHYPPTTVDLNLIVHSEIKESYLHKIAKFRSRLRFLLRSLRKLWG